MKRTAGSKEYVFLPLAAEDLVGWHPLAVEQVKKLGAALARLAGEEKGVLKSQLFQRLSLVLIKGNAAIFSNHIPDI